MYIEYLRYPSSPAQRVANRDCPLCHRTLTANVTEATTRKPRSELSPLYEMTVWASEALAVLVVVVVAVLVPLLIEVDVAAAVAGREESFASVYDDIKVSVARAG